nr:MAG TPA: Thaumarchaeal output domain 1 [Caudoviricetes sp.]
MRYSNFAIEQTKKWLSETAMKNSTPKRLAGHLYEAAEQIAQLQADLKAQVADVQEARHAQWLDAAPPKFYTCSYCGSSGHSIYKFCPWCGASMGGDEG